MDVGCLEVKWSPIFEWGWMFGVDVCLAVRESVARGPVVGCAKVARGSVCPGRGGGTWAALEGACYVGIRSSRDDVEPLGCLDVWEGMFEMRGK